MEPVLKKYYSLDCDANKPREANVGGAQSQQEHASQRNAPLIHSVSIVVELAKESSLGRADEQGPFGPSSASPEVDEPAATARPDELLETDEASSSADPKSSDEDDDDDDDEGLSTDLARKVVIVDEAEKILHTRAASAEPASCCACCCCVANASGSPLALSLCQAEGAALARLAELRQLGPAASVSSTCGSETSNNNNNNNNCDYNKGPPPLPVRPANLRSNTIVSGRDARLSLRAAHQRLGPSQRLASLAADTCSETLDGGRQVADCLAPTSPPPPPGVAERGKLGTRRYTHHALNLAPSSSSSAHFAIDHSIRSQQPDSSTAQLEDGTTTTTGRQTAPDGVLASAAFGGPGAIHQQRSFQHPARSPSSGGAGAAATRDWSQRRQSLQISLLSHYHHHHHHHHHHQHQHQKHANIAATTTTTTTSTSSSSSSGGCHCCLPGKSLTEEEFRGERQFNEQVRSAKSPEIVATSSQLQQKHQSGGRYFASSSASSLLSSNLGGRLRERCHSAAETESPPAVEHHLGADKGASTTRQDKSSNTKTNTNSSNTKEESEKRKAISQRRVSFGSIDPIPRSFLLSDLHKKRASFAALPARTIAAREFFDHRHHSVGAAKTVLLRSGPATGATHNATADGHRDASTGTGGSASGVGASQQAPKSVAPLAPPLPPRSSRKGGPGAVGWPAEALCEENYRADGSVATKLGEQAAPKSGSISALSASNNIVDEPTSSGPQNESSGKTPTTDRTASGVRANQASSPPLASGQPIHRAAAGNHNNYDNKNNRVPTAMDSRLISSGREPRQVSGRDDNQDGTTIRAPSTGQARVDDEAIIAAAAAATVTKDNINNISCSGSSSSSSSKLKRSLELVTQPDLQQTTTLVSPASPTADKDPSRVQSIMANARLRQEEFARLLEEHEQIVNEINRVETKMSHNITSTKSLCGPNESNQAVNSD